MSKIAKIISIITAALELGDWTAQKAAEDCYYSGRLSNALYQRIKWKVRFIVLASLGLTGGLWLRLFEIHFYSLVKKYGDNEDD